MGSFDYYQLREAGFFVEHNDARAGVECDSLQVLEPSNQVSISEYVGDVVEHGDFDDGIVDLENGGVRSHLWDAQDTFRRFLYRQEAEFLEGAHLVNDDIAWSLIGIDVETFEMQVHRISALSGGAARTAPMEISCAPFACFSSSISFD